MTIIFETIAGSRLYGLDHAGSDKDLFSVYDFKRPKASHKVTNELDHVRIGVFRFLDLAYSGAHQSVEALFSPYKEWTDERWRSMLENVRITDGAAFNKYERTIRSFCYGDFKRRRHAVRLNWGLQELRESGTLNPVLTELQVTGATVAADHHQNEELEEILLGYVKNKGDKK